jgi:hypothetical protein
MAWRVSNARRACSQSVLRPAARTQRGLQLHHLQSVLCVHTQPSPPPPPVSRSLTQHVLGVLVALDPRGVALPVGRHQRKLVRPQQHGRRAALGDLLHAALGAHLQHHLPHRRGGGSAQGPPPSATTPEVASSSRACGRACMPAWLAHAQPMSAAAAPWLRRGRLGRCSRTQSHSPAQPGRARCPAAAAAAGGSTRTAHGSSKGGCLTVVCQSGPQQCVGRPQGCCAPLYNMVRAP